MAGKFLAPDVFARLGLGEMKVRALSCRQTTCQLSYDFPSRLANTVSASGLPPSSPMVLVEEALGWAAPRGAGFRKTSFEREGQAYTRISVVLGFDEGSWDPGRYGQWVDQQLPASQAFYRQAREALKNRALHAETWGMGGHASPGDAG